MRQTCAASCGAAFGNTPAVPCRLTLVFLACISLVKPRPWRMRAARASAEGRSKTRRGRVGPGRACHARQESRRCPVRARHAPGQDPGGTYPCRRRAHPGARTSPLDGRCRPCRPQSARPPWREKRTGGHYGKAGRAAWRRGQPGGAYLLLQALALRLALEHSLQGRHLCGLNLRPQVEDVHVLGNLKVLLCTGARGSESSRVRWEGLCCSDDGDGGGRESARLRHVTYQWR